MLENNIPKLNITDNTSRTIPTTQTQAPKNDLIFNFDVNDNESFMGCTFSNNNSVIQSDDLINKKIEKARQGGAGDCWLLAQINALADTKDGAKIIEDAITINGDGTYTVEFKRVGKKYTVTRDELNGKGLPKKQRRGVRGDKDMRLLEIAFEKYYNDERIKYSQLTNESNISDKQRERSIDGGSSFRYYVENSLSQNVAFLLSEEKLFISLTSSESKIVELLKLKMECPDEIWLNFATLYDIKTEKPYKKAAHQLSIVGVETDPTGKIINVKIKDPHDNSKIITKSFDKFMELQNEVLVTARNTYPVIEYRRGKFLNSISIDGLYPILNALYEYPRQDVIKILGGVNNTLTKFQISQNPDNLIRLLICLFPQGDKTVENNLPDFSNDRFSLNSYIRELEENFIFTPVSPEYPDFIGNIFKQMFPNDYDEILKNPEVLKKYCEQYGYEF